MVRHAHAFCAPINVGFAVPNMKPFAYFGTSHITALGLIPVVSLLLVVLAGRHSRRITCIRRLLAALLAINWSLWMLLLYANGWLDVGNALPLNLCDWATVATILALLDPVQRFYDLSFFWALCGTLQALVTPDCRFDFPDRQFILFFVYHDTIIISVIFLALAERMRPYLSSMRRVTGWSLLYAGAAGCADWILGTDYGFLKAKPTHPSLLDYMAPWPWYLPELFLAGIFFMALWYTPFAIGDLMRGRKLDWQPV